MDAKVPTDRETGRPRGFAFVEFESDDGAQRCIEQLNGRDLKGRPLRVNEAENRPPRPAGAPGGPVAAASRGPAGAGGGFSRPGGGGGGASRAPAAAGGFSRPGGGFRAARRLPRARGDRATAAGRRFRQKPEQKPARKTSPRRRRDDVVEDDDEY